MKTRIGTVEQAEMVTLDADDAAGVFALAHHWITTHPGVLVMGVDYDYDPGDPSIDDQPLPRPHVLRLTVVGAFDRTSTGCGSEFRPG